MGKEEQRTVDEWPFLRSTSGGYLMLHNCNNDYFSAVNKFGLQYLCTTCRKEPPKYKVLILELSK